MERGTFRHCPARLPKLLDAPACLALRVGNYEQALHWLEITPDKPNFLLPFMNVDPIYDPVRSDPRFQTLLERMNLKQSK